VKKLTRGTQPRHPGIASDRPVLPSLVHVARLVCLAQAQMSTQILEEVRGFE
jgi:hypothetical protein